MLPRDKVEKGREGRVEERGEWREEEGRRGEEGGEEKQGWWGAGRGKEKGPGSWDPEMTKAFLKS